MVNWLLLIGCIFGILFKWNVSGLMLVLCVNLLMVDLNVNDLMVFSGEWVELISGVFVFFILWVLLM